jgi:hypothetical protein
VFPLMCESTVDGGNCVVCAAARSPPSVLCATLTSPSVSCVLQRALAPPPPRGGAGEAIVVVNIAHCMGLTGLVTSNWRPSWRSQAVAGC